ncbi:hypothetical protein Phi39:1_gp20 [Cellulophaga phage phi39:1]|uniref:hypothetical protein n=1 Tax=Cellulophaga phage phi39:1 TaxID=1327993 RepID=UPI000351F078|nr:hypothetical protein Phi39:1_gp20 [Cellulophaga phage phi39:1]AGO49135.1 hypothetical protein Phi39:1_gp20 [Cellulophaga phage phi39:1]
MGLGELGMTETELDEITPRSLINKLNGFRKADRDKWERVRVQTFLLLSVNFKEGATVTPQEVMPFPWDKELVVSAKEKAKEAREAAKKIWDSIDNK